MKLWVFDAMRGRGRRLAQGRGTEAARALHRLAFALWRAVFYLQRAPAEMRARSRSLGPTRKLHPLVCNIKVSNTCNHQILSQILYNKYKTINIYI